MSDAEFTALVDEAVSATGVERYRWLCSDANTLAGDNSREAWRRWIVERRWVPSDTPIALPHDYADRLPPLGGCCS